MGGELDRPALPLDSTPRLGQIGQVPAPVASLLRKFAGGMVMRPIVLFLPLMLIGCEAADQGYRDRTAAGFESDCTSSKQATTPRLKRELGQLCSCTGAKIRSSDIRVGDGSDAVTAKIQEAMAQCQEQVYPEGPDPSQ